MRLQVYSLNSILYDSLLSAFKSVHRYRWKWLRPEAQQHKKHYTIFYHLAPLQQLRWENASPMLHLVFIQVLHTDGENCLTLLIFCREQQTCYLHSYHPAPWMQFADSNCHYCHRGCNHGAITCCCSSCLISSRSVADNRYICPRWLARIVATARIECPQNTKWSYGFIVWLFPFLQVCWTPSRISGPKHQMWQNGNAEIRRNTIIAETDT